MLGTLLVNFGDIAIFTTVRARKLKIGIQVQLFNIKTCLSNLISLATNVQEISK